MKPRGVFSSGLICRPCAENMARIDKILETIRLADRRDECPAGPLDQVSADPKVIQSSLGR